VSTRLAVASVMLGRQSKCFFEGQYWDDDGVGTRDWVWPVTWTAQSTAVAAAFTLDIQAQIETGSALMDIRLEAYNVQVLKIRRT